MITLYQLPGAWGLPSVSPFCMKLETYLRMVKLPYESKDANVRTAPNGKVPYLQDGETRLGDSGLIIDHLKKKYGDPLDARLTAEESARGHAIRRMLEESLYFAVVYTRWLEDAGWPIIRAQVEPMMPPVMRSVVPPLIRSSIRKALRGQGIARHTDAEVHELAKADIAAFSTLLGEQLFVLGAEPTSVDASAYAFLAHILVAPFASPLRELASSLPNLVAYNERMKARYYPA